MPNVSNRLRTLNGSGSDGWEILYKSRAMIAAGTPVTELTIGEHDIGTDPAILDAMQTSAANGHTGYATVPGITELRAEVAKRVSDRTGVTTTPDNVLITPGGQSALFSAHMAACNPGDTALYIDPYYATYPGTLRAAGALPHGIQTKPNNAFHPTREDLNAAPDAASLLLNSPNNPTGTVYNQSTWDSIADFVQTRDLWLISDEVYDSQVWDDAHVSPRSLPDMAERTLVIGSMSKSFAMTGSRIGWIIAPEDTIGSLIDLATTTTYGVPGYIQDAALWALQNSSGLEAKIAQPFHRRRDLVLNLLETSNTIRCIPPRGAMYMMLDISSTGLSGADFADRLLEERHIAVMPGESFGQAAAGHIRVALTVSDDKLAAAITELAGFAQEVCEKAT